MKRLWPLLLLTCIGCTTAAKPPQGKIDRRAIYQEIANALPDASFDWGTPPGVVEMAKSTKAEGPPPELEGLTATERGFRVRMHVYRPRTVWIPYKALRGSSYGWKTMPNVLLCPFIFFPLQAVSVSVQFDTSKITGLAESVQREVKRLESVSREVGLSGPWSYAQDVKAKIQADEGKYGEGIWSVHFDTLSMVPAIIPYGGQGKDRAEAFAWVQANHDAPLLEPKDDKETILGPGEGD